jgi:hypothetical protein
MCDNCFTILLDLVPLNSEWTLTPTIKYGVYLGSTDSEPYSLAEAPSTPSPPPPAFGLIYENGIGQPR